MTGITLLLPYLGRWDQFRKSRFHQISERLAARGHTIHVVQAPMTDSNEVTFSRRSIDLPENVHLHEAKLNDRLWSGASINKVAQKGYYGVGVRKQIRNLIATEDVDLLWLYNLPHYLLARIDEVPIVFDFVDDYIAMLNSELGVPSVGPLEAVEQFAFGRMLNRTSVVTVISHELQRSVEEMVGTTPPSVVVPNGVDLDVFELQLEPRSSCHDPPVVGFVGSFEYFIDFDLILDAAESLPEVTFLLVGDGREYEYVESETKRRGLENVELPGLVESSEVPEYISQMDICLNTFERIPLAHSAVPLKLFEYLSQCRPVVSTRIAEVQHIDDGFLYYADTKSEITEQIKTILDDYPAAIERTSHSRSYVGETYNWDAIAEQFESTIIKYVDT